MGGAFSETSDGVASKREEGGVEETVGERKSSLPRLNMSLSVGPTRLRVYGPISYITKFPSLHPSRCRALVNTCQAFAFPII